ncbi:MAG: hypothetical protein IJ656_00395 [Bacilli bacterium]|nr:hypothetical protein [Bacilli bacterium]
MKKRVENTFEKENENSIFVAEENETINNKRKLNPLIEEYSKKRMVRLILYYALVGVVLISLIVLFTILGKKVL